MRKSVTLIELLIAMTLLGVILLGISSFDIAGKRFFRSSERKSGILNDMSFILDHIDKYVSMATGTGSDPGITTPGAFPAQIVRIRVAIDDATGSPDTTPMDYTNDRVVEYSAVGNRLQFCPRVVAGACPAGFISLTERLVRTAGNDFEFDNAGVNANQLIVRNLILRHDPLAAVDPTKNPEVSMVETSAGQEIIFNSFIHGL